MAPREQDIDHICTECGLVTIGPHKGEHAPRPVPSEYKGAPVSHALCEDCAAEHVKYAKGRAYVREHRERLAPPAEPAVTKTARYRVASRQRQQELRRYATWDDLMADIRKKPGE